MREILFRGKRKNGNHEWIYGNLNVYHNINRSFIRLQPGENVMDCTLEDEVIDETIGQYTGVKDANGKKIFEGDVMSNVPPKFETSSVCVVEYSTDYTAFEIVGKKSHFLGPYSRTGVVVGNIHDNPELLTDDEKE